MLRIMGSDPRLSPTAERCRARGSASRIVAAHAGPTFSSTRACTPFAKASSSQEAMPLLPAVGGGKASRLASVRTRRETSSGRRWASTMATAPPMLCAISSAPVSPAASSAAAKASAWSLSV
jgi:hypothetical protein